MTHFVLRQTLMLEIFFCNQNTQKANETWLYIWVQFTLLSTAPLLSVTILYSDIAVNLRIRESQSRHPCKCTTTCYEKTETSYYNNGAWYLGAVLPLCFSTHFAAFHPILEAFLCHSESTTFYDDFLALFIFHRQSNDLSVISKSYRRGLKNNLVCLHLKQWTIWWQNARK